MTTQRPTHRSSRRRRWTSVRLSARDVAHDLQQRHSLRWHGLFGRFGDKQSDWWAGLAEVNVPVLAVAGAGDHQDPVWACRKLFEQVGSEHRQYLCLGRQQGFSGDFGHVEMLVSKAAQREVWPLVERWLGGTTLDPLRAANRHLGHEAFRWRVVSPDGRPVPLTPRITEEEAAAHAAFVGKLGDGAIWKRRV